MITAWLAQRYKRRAIATRNVAFYAWKFGANAIPTFHALRMWRAGRRHRDTVAVLREQGIVMADTSRFLTEAGRAALADATTGSSSPPTATGCAGRSRAARRTKARRTS